MDGSKGCGVHAGRLGAAEYAINFADAHPPLTAVQASIEAERCYYCYDAPCMTACPTGIDVPSFIARIAQDNIRGAARTILESNPLGASAASARGNRASLAFVVVARPLSARVRVFCAH